VPLVKQLAKQTIQLDAGDPVKKSYFGVLATLILLIVLIILIYPAVKHVTKLNKEISDARVTKATLETKLANLKRAKANLEEVGGNLSILDLAIPIGSDLTPYLQKIEVLAKKSKLKIIAVQFTNIPLSKPEAVESLKSQKLDYSVTVEGSFPNFRKFLAYLENFIRTSDVTIVDLAKNQDGDLQETVDVTSYYLGIKFAPTTTTPTKEDLEAIGE